MDNAEYSAWILWRFGTRLRELDRDDGDAEEAQDCLNELTANVLHAPTESLRMRSQSAIDAHYRHEAMRAHG